MCLRADGPAIVRQRVFIFFPPKMHTHVYKKYKTIFLYKKKIISRFVNRTGIRAEHSSPNAKKRYDIYFRSIVGEGWLAQTRRR